MSIFSDLVNVFKQDAAKDILPVLLADIQQIAANPDLVLNPISQPVELMKLQNDLLQAVSPAGPFAHDLIKDVSDLLIAYVQNVQQPAAIKAKAKVAAATMQQG